MDPDSSQKLFCNLFDAEDLEFPILIFQGTEFTAQYFQKYPHRIPDFLDHIFEHCTIDVALRHSLWILCGNEDPNVCLQRLQEKLPRRSKICGAIFKVGAVAYRCKTCEIDPNWLIDFFFFS
jgi:hypothetical protein